MTYFNASLLFGYNTIDYSGTTPNKYNRVQIDGHISSLGLRLPLDFGLKFYDTQLVRLSVYTGPHLFFNFSLKAKYNEKRAYTEEKVDKDYTHSGMEIAWGLGLAADFAYRWHIHVEGVYGLSRMGRTNDIQVGETTHFNRAALSIGLGYNF